MNNNGKMHNFHRSLICIEEIHTDIDANIINILARVPSWDPYSTIHIPPTLFKILKEFNVQPGSYFIGDVTIGASTPNELEFKNLKKAVIPYEEKI